MKKSSLVFTVLLGLVLFFQSCEKEESTLSSNNEVTGKQQTTNLKSIGINHNDLVNSNNPYDANSAPFPNIYANLEGELISLIDNDPNITMNEIEGAVSSALTPFLNQTYSTVSTSGYTESESVILKPFFENASLNNLVTLSQSTENSVNSNNSLNTVQKNRLLSIISQFKFHFLYGQIMVNNITNRQKANNGTRFRVCLGNKAAGHFEDNGSIVGEVAYIVGLPWSFFWDAADCAVWAVNSSAASPSGWTEPGQGEGSTPGGL